VTKGFGSIGMAALIVACAAPALAQDYEAAGRHFAQAQEAFAKGQFNRAADEFEAAYAITKDAVLLFNIGESYEKAGNARGAVRYYRKYVAEQPQATDRSEVDRRIQALEKKAGIEPPPPTPITPPPAPASSPPSNVPPATLANPFDKPAEPAQAAPAPASAPQPETATSAPAAGPLDEEHPSTTKVVAWIGVATTVALLTAGAIFGLAAQSRSDEITRREIMTNSDGTPPKFDMMTEQTFNQLSSEGKTFDAVGITLLSAAGVVAVISGVLFFVDSRNHGDKTARLRLTPTLDPKHAGLAAGWEF
jgi:hypothetical protein